jgi:hypothetical protein
MFSRMRWIVALAAIAAVAGAVPGGWEAFRSERALATADFPVLPEEKISFVEGKDFRLERVAYACESGRAAYRMTSVLMPEIVRAGRKPEEILRASALAATPKGWTMSNEAYISTDNASAVRFVATPAQGFESHHYFYLTPARLYTLVVVVPPGEAEKCEVDRFFASFKVLEPTPVEPPK